MRITKIKKGIKNNKDTYKPNWWSWTTGVGMQGEVFRMGVGG